MIWLQGERAIIVELGYLLSMEPVDTLACIRVLLKRGHGIMQRKLVGNDVKNTRGYPSYVFQERSQVPESNSLDGEAKLVGLSVVGADERPVPLVEVKVAGYLLQGRLIN